MKPHRGRTVAIVAAVIALLVVVGAGFLVARRADWIPDRVAPRRALLPRSATYPHSRVDLGAGQIELQEILRFLGELTGLLVRFDVTDSRITQAKLVVAAPMEDIDAEIVRALIEASGFSVEVETMFSGMQFIRVGVEADRGKR